MEAPWTRHRGKCKMTYFFALKHKSKWIFAVHPHRTNTGFSIPVLAQRRIYTDEPHLRHLKNRKRRKGHSAKIHLEHHFAT